MPPNEIHRLSKEELASFQVQKHMLQQPLRDQAIKLILEAAQPDGLTVTDEGGQCRVSPEGRVSGGFECESLQNVNMINLLYWSLNASDALALRALTSSPTSDPTGLGI